MKLGLVMTCHAAYLKFLPEAVAAWEMQGGCMAQKVVVLDGVDEAMVPVLPVGWEVVRGAWGDPCQARNAGLVACAVDWVIFWDADNVPQADYAMYALSGALAAGSDTGVLAPAVRDAQDRLLNEAVFAGGDARCDFVLDTASVWRREAVLFAGGWREGSPGLDDWGLAVDLVAGGWKIRPLAGVVVRPREHAERRTHSKDPAACLWHHRRVGVVVLLSGRVDLVGRWFDALEKMRLPARVGLTVVMPAARPGLVEMAVRRVSAMPVVFERVSFVTPGRVAMPTLKAESRLAEFNNTHRTVGALYAAALAATPEEVVLTWEDDVFPHGDDALARLSALLTPGSRVAAVAAVYPSRGNERLAVAAVERGSWAGVPALADLTDKPLEVGNIAGGFTLWQRAALVACPILGAETGDNGTHIGWDGGGCRRLTRAGWRLLLHGGVRCEHVTKPGGRR